MGIKRKTLWLTQGKNKAETSKIYGDEMVKKWRRSYDIPPPKLSELEVAEEKNKANFQLIKL